tara:strand:- start:77 stop:607 length:531 start_codon:yes stop_codon:yes gene_type:complete
MAYNSTSWTTDSLTKATNSTSTNDNSHISGNLTVIGNIVEGRTVIKVPATDFMGNDDDFTADSFSFAAIDDTSAYGVQSGSNSGELFAMVDVPLGYTATKVVVYGSDSNNDVIVNTLNITSGIISSEISNAGLEVGDDTALDTNHVGSDTNLLCIEVVVSSTSDLVYGAIVTIEPT